jgi:hypothetical protein
MVLLGLALPAATATAAASRVVLRDGILAGKEVVGEEEEGDVSKIY